MTYTPLVECRHLCHTFQSGGSERIVLDNIDWSVEHGSLIALMGPSGSGKSTLLNILGGLVRPSAGTVRVGGQELTTLDASELSSFRSGITGFIFQEWNLLRDLTVLENVMLPLRLSGQSPSDAERRSIDLLNQLGLTSCVSKFPEALSGGEQQRVAIARAAVAEKPLILADEPTGSLDQANGATVMELLKVVASDGCRSVVVATHDPSVANSCDQIWHLVDGRLSRVGSQ